MVYERVKTGVTQQEIEDYGYDYLLVVLSDERDEGYNVWGEGPEYVVFSGTLYRKSNEDPVRPKPQISAMPLLIIHRTLSICAR